MRIILTVVIALVISGTIYGQQGKYYVVKAGEIPGEVLPSEALYAFAVFREGVVYFKNGSTSTQKLNYNHLLQEMQFIGPNNDTLAIADPAIIKNIVIDTFVYYYDKGFMQMVFEIDSFKLAVRRTLLQSEYQTRSGYGIGTSSSSITTYGSIAAAGQQIIKLQVQKDVRFIEKEVFFIGDKFNNFYKADKGAFLRVFHTKKNIIQKYLNSNNINYSRESDLKNLLKFCAENNE